MTVDNFFNDQKINISIVMAVKNEELHIKEAIESILQQSGVNIELIIVNDHSIDNTEQIIKHILLTDKRISLCPNPGKGKCSAFNFGISISKGNLICLFAGDDIMPQNSLYNRAKTIIASKIQADRPIICTSKVKIYNPHSKLHNLILPRNKNLGSEIGGALMFNRTALEYMFPVPTHLPNEDTWMKLHFHYIPEFKIIHSTEIGCIWRHHGGNSSGYGSTYEIYSKKYTKRMQATSFFLNKYEESLSPKSIKLLESTIRCETSRVSKRFLNILSSGAPRDEILRAIFLYNKKLYNIKSILYSLLSRL